MGGGMLNTSCTCYGLKVIELLPLNNNGTTALSILAVSSVAWKSFSSSFNSLIGMLNGMGMAIRLPFSSSA
jgi:hypothetical protein